MASVSFCQPIENQFTHYTTKDGLPDGIIRDIKQDSTGFLWLATANGISRFDGHTFKNFRYIPGDTTSICENHLNSIFIDSKNRLWFLSPNWLYLYHQEDGRFEHFNMDGFSADKICVEENGELIIASYAKGLYKFNIANKMFSRFHRDGTPNSEYRYYVKDEDGIEWLSIKNALTRYDPKTNKSQVVFPNFGPLALMPKGLLVAGTFDQGLLLINRQTIAVKRFLPDKNDPNSIVNVSITCLYPLNDSIVLVGTEKGLSVFNINTEKFDNIVPVKTNP